MSVDIEKLRIEKRPSRVRLEGRILFLLDDAKLRDAMGRKARVRVEGHFSWSSIARSTLAF